MNLEQKLFICSICNTIIDKADPNKEYYSNSGLGVDENGVFWSQLGDDLSDDEYDVTAHLSWVFEILCNEL